MKKAVTLLLIIGLSFSATAQMAEPEFDHLDLRDDFLRNFNLYTTIFIEPVIETINYNSTSGWQFTAAPLKPGEVRIDISTQATFQSDVREFFNFNERPFTEEIELERTFNDDVPKALGGPTDRTFEYVIEDNDGNEYRQEISAWSGAPTPFTSTSTAVPIISIGLPSSTEVSLRFFPYMAFRGVEHTEIGVGLKHEVGQYTELGEKWNRNVGMFYNLNRFGYEPKKTT